MGSLLACFFPSEISSGDDFFKSRSRLPFPIVGLEKYVGKSIDFDLIVEYIDSTTVNYLKGKSIVGHIEESVDDDALRENEVPFEDAVFENVPTGQEVNDNGKEVNEVHFGVDESLEKINNKEIHDEILENFVVDTKPLSMTQILNEPSVMTQLEIEAYNIISKQSGKPCSPIHSLVVGESSKQNVIEDETEEFYKEAIEA
ncbi:hypothetical protein L2E82_15288 [Cichorium intybus]|uniref:Uncharacterized protein n=1 Tax=Cichorium intybus TaxID=13427 RepID=A0ACB9F3A7_CICIN|nr:hypothetical protein L2E82_15288 [Cichorium intybus]